MANRGIKIGIIGGTGVGEALGAEKGEAREVETPFGRPSSALVSLEWAGVDVVVLQRHGVGHLIPPSFVNYRANVFALKQAGVTHVIASGATGSLREDVHPGELVIVDQVIDRTFRRAGTFFEKAAVHVEFDEPFCPVTRHWLLAASLKIEEMRVHDKGTYVCMEGPAFSTRAESAMHRTMGGDLIGMTAMPEAKLAREAEMAYAMIALPTDYDCWKPKRLHDVNTGRQELLKEIMGNLKRATSASISLIKAALGDVGVLEAKESPAHEALKMAIWSDKGKIEKEEVERLRVLWGRYF